MEADLREISFMLLVQFEFYIEILGNDCYGCNYSSDGYYDSYVSLFISPSVSLTSILYPPILS